MSDLEQQFLSAYDQYADALYRHCVFRVYDAAKAEDLVQDTFMRTWQYLASGKEVENLRAFLYRVANNAIIDYSRKRKEDSLDALLVDQPGLEPSRDSTVDAQHRLLLDYVLGHIRQLPDDARDVLLLRYLDDMEPREIALILGISANNVSVRLNRAMRLLQDRLKQ
jgi:RNA polymerase sigma factor (sigma-70 family)